VFSKMGPTILFKLINGVFSMKCFSGKTLLAVSFGASLALTACGGGGSSKSGRTTPAAEQPITSGYSEVEGPLDAVQQPLSEQVITSWPEQRQAHRWKER
jgi:hypothetical protein